MKDLEKRPQSSLSILNKHIQNTVEGEGLQSIVVLSDPKSGDLLFSLNSEYFISLLKKPGKKIEASVGSYQPPQSGGIKNNLDWIEFVFSDLAEILVEALDGIRKTESYQNENKEKI